MSSRLLLPGFAALLSLSLGMSAASAAEPRIITIKALPAQMRYDLNELMMEPGEEVKIVFENPDDMPHNLVFFHPGTDVVEVSNKQMEKPEEALKRDWLPEDPRLWVHSKLLRPKEKDELLLRAPEKPGVYPYVCTFPGHAMTMQGRLKIFPRGPQFSSLKFAMYLGDFKWAPDFSKQTLFREGDLPGNLIEIKLDDYRNNFGVVYTGKIRAPKDGEYRFHFASDDGGKVFLDGEEIMSDGTSHDSTIVHDTRKKLKAGEHELRVEYFQGTGPAELFVAWEGEEFGLTPLSTWVHPAFLNGGRPPPRESPPLPLVVGKTPVIYRNHIVGAGQRGIMVGYPGQVNIAWSAEWMNLAMTWRGAFVDTRHHWLSRGGMQTHPFGYDVTRPTGERALPFAQLTSPDAKWPIIQKEGERTPDYKWRGYTLDEKLHPTFHYTWKNLNVSDYFEVTKGATADDSKLIRITRIDGEIPADASFRAATGHNLVSTPEGFDMVIDRVPISVSVQGGRIAWNGIVVPAQKEIRVTYAWKISHGHHAH
ncbi:MAG TPA: PA14 domain-containing protein [Chthoniobacteraceae bacterium]|jgi:azurin